VKFVNKGKMRKRRGKWAKYLEGEAKVLAWGRKGEKKRRPRDPYTGGEGGTKWVG